MELVGLEVILSPEGSSTAKQHHVAPRRFNTLDGLRVGLLGNSKLNADAVLLAIGDLLKEQYAVDSIFMRSKPTFSKPAPEDVIDEMLANADVLITGVGD